MRTLLLIALAAGAALAADEKAPVAPVLKTASEPEAKAGPVLSTELQMEYFRADGVLAHLKADLDRANAEYEAAVAAIVKACGEGAAPTLTQDKKHLFCVAQAPAAKK